MKIKNFLMIVMLLVMSISSTYAEKIYKNRDTVLYLLEEGAITLSQLDESYRKDKEVVMMAVAQDGNALEYADESLRRNLEVVLMAVKRDSSALRYASESLKRNKMLEEYVDTSFKQEEELFPEITSEAKVLDKKLLIDALENSDNGCSELVYLEEQLKKDKLFLSEIAEEYYMCDVLEHADISLKRDKKFILSLIENSNVGYSSIAKSLKTDRELALDFVKNSAYNLPLIDKNFLSNNHFILSVIKETGYGLRYATKEQQSDKALVLWVLKHDADAFPFIGNDLKKERTFIKEALTQNGQVLAYVDKKYANDKELVLIAVKEDGYALEYASSMLRYDREVVTTAIGENIYVLPYAHDMIKRDKKFMLSILEKDGSLIDNLNEKFQEDKEFVVVALKTYAEALSYVDTNLTEDRDFILNTLKENAYVLEYVNEKFKKDKELVTRAVLKDVDVLEYADETLRTDKPFLFSLIEINSDVVEYIDSKIWEDKQFLEKVIREIGYGLKYANKEQKNNRELLLKAIKHDSYSLEFASNELKKDKALVLKALEEYAYPLTFADKSLREDREFIKKAINVNGFTLLFASQELQEDRELVLLAVKQNEYLLENLSSRFKRDKEIVTLSVKYDKENLQYADEILRKDKKFIIELIEQDINILPYVDEVLKNDAELIKLSTKIEYKYEALVDMVLFLAIVIVFFFIYFTFVRKEHNKKYLLLIVLLLLAFSQLLKTYFTHGVFRAPYVLVDENHKYGLEPVKCWLEAEESLSSVECYNMHVPEVYNDEKSRTITFPVRVFRSSDMFSSKPPVIHLGGGGPGASMDLDSIGSLKYFVKEHDAISINQGRDLFVMDPRGSGLAQPRLTCGTYIDNLVTNINKELTLEEEYKAVESDYLECITKFKKEKVNFNGYNSIAIADDIEYLRKSIGIDKWVLFGVSYSTTYAMFVAKKYPKTVERMVLDSACFPNLKLDHNYLLQSMDRYNALYSYEDKIKKEEQKLLSEHKKELNIKERMWRLHKRFNAEPIELDMLNIKLNGNYFINALLWGAYGTEVFNDLPKIILEMERGKRDTFLPYFENYLYFLLDESYGDVSAMAHYCYEDKPFINFDVIKKQNRRLPKGYIQDSAIRAERAKDFCKEMNITSIDKSLDDTIETEIPTLFIHGEFDSITPLRDVVSQMKNFKNAKLSTYKKSHSVMSEKDGVENDVAEFVASPL